MNTYCSSANYILQTAKYTKWHNRLTSSCWLVSSVVPVFSGADSPEGGVGGHLQLLQSARHRENYVFFSNKLRNKLWTDFFIGGTRSKTCTTCAHVCIFTHDLLLNWTTTTSCDVVDNMMNVAVHVFALCITQHPIWVFLLSVTTAWFWVKM